MTRPAALVVAGPGTNRDIDAVLALDLAGAEPAVVLAAELTARPELLDDARIVVVAGGFSYGDALGAGRLLALDLTAAAGQVALRYQSPNPHGSVADIAGVCDPSGVVLGLMPHPENHVIARQHPRHRRDPSTTRTLGLRLFEAAVRHVK